MYYQKQIEETLQACQTSKNGLTQEEVKKRHQEYGYNVLDEKKKESPLLSFSNNFRIY